MAEDCIFVLVDGILFEEDCEWRLVLVRLYERGLF